MIHIEKHHTGNHHSTCCFQVIHTEGHPFQKSTSHYYVSIICQLTKVYEHCPAEDKREIPWR